MFIKHGDGKIISVVEPEELTEEQKKVAKSITVQSKKTVDDNKQNAGSN